MHDDGCEYYAKGGEIPSYESTEAVPSYHDTEAATPPEPSYDETVPVADAKYSSTGQTIAAGAEGVAQGIAGPVATWAESHPIQTGLIAAGPLGIGTLLADKFLGNKTAEGLDKSISEKLGMTKEDIAGRQSAHPVAHGAGEAAGFVGSMLSGVGEGALLTKGAAKIAAKTAAGKWGATALQHFIEGAAFSGADEISKGMLGIGDPEHPWAMAAAHMTAAGILNVAGGGLFNVLGKGLGKLSATKMVQAGEDWLVKLTQKPVTKLVTNYLEADAAHYAMEGLAKIITGDSSASLRAQGLTYGMIKTTLGPTIERIVGKHLGKADAYISDAVINALQRNNPYALPVAARWGAGIDQGTQKVVSAISSIFRAGTTQAVPAVSSGVKDAIKQYVEDGKLQSEIQDEAQQNSMQGYAKGGEVTPAHDHFGTVFPTQNILLNQARGRISGYLNSLRPLPNQKLAFDDDHGDAEKHRTYDKAVNLAANPLHILNHIQAGDLTPEDMKHFTSLWPELYRVLSGKLTEGVTKAQLEGKKPSYSKRQAMSLFLGAPLDSSMQPAAIMAAQGVFAQKKAAQQPQQGAKKRKAPALNKLGESYRTDDEARMARAQKV